jgi:hypothetical protein
MKKIKAVVLKDATKLTNSQMKEIRGGVTVEGRPTKCSMQCDTGAFQPEVTFDCTENWVDYQQGTYCATSATIGIMCIRPDGYIYNGPNCQY